MRAAWAALLAVLATTASAQVIDTVQTGRRINAYEQAEGELKNARFHLGPMGIDPFLSFGGIGYNTTVGGTEQNPSGDYTSHAQGGTDAIVKVAPQAYIRGRIGVSYSWYAHNVDRRQVGFLYGGGVSASIQRFRLSFDLLQNADSKPTSSETTRPVFTTELVGHGIVAYSLAGAFSLLVEGGFQKSDHSDQGLEPGDAATVNSLDKRGTLWGGGVGYEVGDRVGLALKYQRTDTHYDSVLRPDYGSDGIVLSTSYSRGKLFFNFSGGYRSYEAATANGNAPSSGIFTVLYSSYELGRRVSVLLNWHRQTSDSVDLITPTFVDQRIGSGLGYSFPGRHELRVNGFVSYGTNIYDQPVGSPAGTPERRDKVLEYGGGVGFSLVGRFQFHGNVSRSHYESSEPGHDRSVLNLNLGLTWNLDRSRSPNS